MAFIDKQLKTYVLRVCVASLAVLLAACGGGSSSSSGNSTTTQPLTGLKKRVLLSNQLAGSVTIFDAQKDQISTKAFGISGATKLVAASGMTVVMQQAVSGSGASIQVIDNVTETLIVSLALRDQSFDVAISTDGKTGYTAMRNVGQVAVFDTTSGQLQIISGLPLVTRLVEGTNEHKILAFADNANGLVTPGQGTFFVIDTATNTAKSVTGAPLDQPFSAVFDPTDTTDNTAFILNCGPECGGTTASVVRVNFSNPAAPTFGTPVPVSAATVGVLNGTSLFVAGSPSAGSTGTMQTINTGTLSASAPITITNGHHTKMVMASNNRLYIGATACTAVPDPNPSLNLTRGCLSIVNTTSGAVVMPEVSSFRQNFDVTGIQPISGRTVVYVCFGGELDIFDTNSDTAIIPNPPIDIVGKAFDVVLIDP
jgi:hypothetical protein